MSVTAKVMDYYQYYDSIALHIVSIDEAWYNIYIPYIQTQYINQVLLCTETLLVLQHQQIKFSKPRNCYKQLQENLLLATGHTPANSMLPAIDLCNQTANIKINVDLAWVWPDSFVPLIKNGTQPITPIVNPYAKISRCRSLQLVRLHRQPMCT